MVPLLICIAVDVVLITLWFSENTPKPFKIFYHDEKSVSLRSCNKIKQIKATERNKSCL